MRFIGFANPLGFLGLISLPFILLLHLLHQRSRRYVVPSLSLWSFLEVEVRGSRLRRIPISLLLILDLLIAVVLSLAWTQPQFELDTPLRNARHVLLLLDVSASMRASDTMPSRFEQAQSDVLQLLASVDEQDTVTVIAFGSNASWIGDTRSEGRQVLIARVNQLQAGEAQTTAFDSALALALAAPSPEDVPVELHIFTDAAFAEPDLSAVSTGLKWHLYGQETDNQAVITLAATPVEDNTTEIKVVWQVFARMANFGTRASQRNVSLVVDGRSIDSRPLNLPANSTEAQIWTLAEGPATLVVQLDGEDNLPEDDYAAMGLHSPANQIRVGLVATDPGPLQKALQSLPEVDLQLLTSEEYLPGMAFDIVFFRQALPESWPLGTAVILDPPLDNPLFPVDGAVMIDSIPVAATDPILAGIEWGGVRWERAWRLASLPDVFEPLLQSETAPLLISYQIPGSVIYALLADTDSGNLTRHPAFPILIRNLVRSVSALDIPGQVETGALLPLPDAVSYPHIRLTLPEVEPINLADERPDTWTDTLQPGLYTLDLVAADGQEQVVGVGVNAGNLTESAISRGDWPVDREAPIAPEVVSAQRLLNLMPWLLATAVILLVLEAMVAWR